jgi:hypothetical protein
VHYSVRHKGVWVNPAKYIVEANPGGAELASALDGSENLPIDVSRSDSLHQAIQAGGAAAPARPRRGRRR